MMPRRPGVVSRHGSSVGLRWPSKRIAALHRLPIQLGMDKRCALRCAPMAARSLRHLIRDATLGLTAAPAVASAYARERVDADVGPSALAVATIACAAGQMAGPVLTGVVIDVFGIESMAVLVLVGYALATVFAKLDQLHQMRMHQSS